METIPTASSVQVTQSNTAEIKPQPVRSSPTEGMQAFFKRYRSTSSLYDHFEPPKV